MPLFATLISISKHGRFRAHTEVRRADLMLQLFPAWRSRRLQPPDRKSGGEGKRGDLGGGRIIKKKKKRNSWCTHDSEEGEGPARIGPGRRRGDVCEVPAGPRACVGGRREVTCRAPSARISNPGV